MSVETLLSKLRRPSMESEWHVISNVSAITDLVHLLSRKIAQEAKLRDSLVKCMPLIS